MRSSIEKKTLLLHHYFQPLLYRKIPLLQHSMTLFQFVSVKFQVKQKNQLKYVITNILLVTMDLLFFPHNFSILRWIIYWIFYFKEKCFQLTTEWKEFPVWERSKKRRKMILIFWHGTETFDAGWNFLITTFPCCKEFKITWRVWKGQAT